MYRICGLDSYSILKEIGHDGEWVKSKLSLGFKFKLCVFPQVDAVMADWDGIFHLLEKVRSGAVSRFGVRYGVV